MSILRRSLAPITDDAWSEIDDEATGVLRSNLAARQFVDVHGPQGWAYSSVNLGRLGDTEETGGVRWGLRQVQPLVEVRVPFTLSRWELDNVERGARDIELNPVRKAALEAARFEEHAVYNGLSSASIQGLVAGSSHESIALPQQIEAIPDAIAAAMIRLSDAGVVGPYLLVLGADLSREVAATSAGYPLRSQLTKLLGSVPLYSPGLTGGLVVSTRGGDFSLDLGVDFSLGFDRVEGDEIRLFITESFTFRVLGPEAIVVLRT